MSDKPNALRLADALENEDNFEFMSEWHPLVHEAAEHLRRLYESNQRLITALREATLDIGSWARHTIEYFQDERDLKDCIAGYLEIAEKEEALLSGGPTP